MYLSSKCKQQTFYLCRENVANQTYTKIIQHLNDMFPCSMKYKTAARIFIRVNISVYAEHIPKQINHTIQQILFIHVSFPLCFFFCVCSSSTVFYFICVILYNDWWKNCMLRAVSWGNFTVYLTFVRFRGKIARLGHFGCCLPCVTTPLIFDRLIREYRQ